MTRSQVQSCGYGFADTFVCEVFSGVFPAVFLGQQHSVFTQSILVY